MTNSDHVVARLAARAYAPIIAAFAASLAATHAAGSGIGAIAALVFALAQILHVLLYGAAAFRRAFPAWVARGALGVGLLLACVIGARRAGAWAPHLLEAALFLSIAGACALVIVSIAGRAPTLRDETW